MNEDSDGQRDERAQEMLQMTQKFSVDRSSKTVFPLQSSQVQINQDKLELFNDDFDATEQPVSMVISPVEKAKLARVVPFSPENPFDSVGDSIEQPFHVQVEGGLNIGGPDSGKVHPLPEERQEEHGINDSIDDINRSVEENKEGFANDGLAKPLTVNTWIKKLPEDVRQEYYRTKMFREVNPHIDAPIEKHVQMIGSQHNTMYQKEYANPVQSSSDEEDVNDTKQEWDGREARTGNFNKHLWMKSYALKFEIPTSHVIDARIFATEDQTYIMQLLKFIIPSELRTKMTVQPPLPFFDELNKFGNIMLRVLYRGKGASLKLAKAVILKGFDPITCFSQDGSMFAYLVSELVDENVVEPNPAISIAEQAEGGREEKKIVDGKKKRRLTVDEKRLRYMKKNNTIAKFKTKPEMWHAMKAKISNSDPLETKKLEARTDISNIRRMLYVVKIDKTKKQKPTDMCEYIKDENYLAKIDVTKATKKMKQHDGSPLTQEQQSFSFLKAYTEGCRMEFDMNNQCLCGYGGRNFFMLDLSNDRNQEGGSVGFDSSRLSIHEINDFLYQNIISMTICTNARLDAAIYGSYLKGFDSKNLAKDIDPSDKKIFIAASRNNDNTIDVFEYFQDRKFRNDVMKTIDSEQDLTADEVIEEKIKQLLTKQAHITTLEAQADSQDEDIIIQISHNGHNIFFAEKMNRFLITVKDGGKNVSQRRLWHLARNFNIEFVEEDLYDDGFYLCCCKDYDSNVRLMHTHRDYFKCYLDWFVEKGTVRFYDLHVDFKKVLNKEQGDKIFTDILLLGLDHNKFTIDFSQSQEGIPSDDYLHNQDYDRRSEYKKLKKAYKTINNDAHDYFEYGCYAMNWPLFTFGDFLGNVYLVNAFDRYVMYRIPIDTERKELADAKKDDLKICSIHLTPNQQLFVLVLLNSRYKLYQVNLIFRSSTFNLDDYERRIKKKIEDVDEEFRNDPKAWGDDLEAAYKERITTEGDDISFGKPILEYDEKQTFGELEDAFQMVVRDAEDSTMGFRKRLFAFILHGQKLIYWMKSDDDDAQAQVHLVMDNINGRRLRACTADSFIFSQKLVGDKWDEKSQGEIWKVKIHYMTHSIISLYKEEMIEEDIRTYNYDPQRDKVIMLVRHGRKPNEFENVDRRQYHLKLFDIKLRKVQINIVLKRPEIIGILNSGYYTVVDGHIYHHNSVIKMRYDLLENDIRFQENMTEDQFFDIYQSLFPIRPGCRISSANLLNSIEAHRFAFISEDTENQRLPTLVRITPYLHERRIYLRQRAPNKNYFLTCVDISAARRQKYNQHIYDEIIGKSELENVQNCQREDKILVKLKKRKTNCIENLSVIIRMNITDSIFHVYSQNGMLLKRVDFQHIKNVYGDPICCSNNGKVLVFRLKANHLQYIHTQSQKQKKKEEIDEGVKLAMEKAVTFSLIEMTPTGLSFMRQVNVYKGIENHFQSREEGKEYGTGPQTYEKFMEKYDWFFQHDVNKLLDTVDMRVEVNNMADVCLRFSPKVTDAQRMTGKQPSTLIYFEKGNFIEQEFFDDCGDHDHSSHHHRSVLVKSPLMKSIVKNAKETKTTEDDPFRTIFDPDDILGPKNTHLDIMGVTMNNKRLVFWTNKKVFSVSFVKLNYMIYPNYHLETPDFELTHCTTRFPYIQRVRTSNDEKGKYTAICVRKQENPGLSSIIIWHLGENYERGQYQVDDPYFIAFDQNGDVFICDVENDQIAKKRIKKVSLCNQKTTLTSFDYNEEDVERMFNLDQFNMDEQVESGIFGISKGSRFDHKNHHWMLFDDYMSLSYSYMSFVIKDHLERNDGDCEDRQFDIEGYNYLFNRRSSFMDSTFARKDTEEMLRVLQNLERIGPQHLGIINYCRRAGKNTKEKTILEKAAEKVMNFGGWFQKAEKKVDEKGEDKKKQDDDDSRIDSWTDDHELDPAESKKDEEENGQEQENKDVVSWVNNGVTNFGGFIAQTAKQGAVGAVNLARIDQHGMKILGGLAQTANLLEGEEKPDQTEFDSALHIALSHQAPLNVEHLLKYMGKIDTRGAANFRDIINKLVEYENFDLYLEHMLLQTDYMVKYKMIRVLKDPLFNFSPTTICTCKKRYGNNLDDESIIQNTTSNTTYFSPDMFEGLLIESGREDNKQYYKQKELYYGFAPITIQALQLDWLLEDVSKENKQPRGIALLQAIYQSNNMEYYNIPAIQALICFFYSKLVKHEQSPFIIFIQTLDLVQVILQVLIMNNLITRITEECDDDDLTCEQSWEVDELHKSSVFFGQSSFERKLQIGQLVLAGTQGFLIIFNLSNLGKQLQFYFTTKGQPMNNVSFCSYWFIVLYEMTVYISRVFIIVFSAVMYIWMDNQVPQEFEDLEKFARWVRIVLVLNVFYSLSAIQNSLTLVWESASVFVDLIAEVVLALIPFAIFLSLYLFTYFLAFYMFGQHQVGFDYYHEVNQDDIKQGIIQDCVMIGGTEAEPIWNYESCDDRYDDLLGDAREENKESAPYDNGWLAFMFVYQMLMGDASHEYFYEMKTKTTGSATPIIMYIMYILATSAILLVLLNIIIAIMSDTQATRTGLGRSVIYKNQLSTVLSRIYRFDHTVDIGTWKELAAYYNQGVKDPMEIYQGKYPRYLTIALRRSIESESQNAELKAQIDKNHNQMTDLVKLKTFQLEQDLQTITKLIKADKMEKSN